MSSFIQRASGGLRHALAVAAALLVLPVIGGGGITGTGHTAWGLLEDFGSVFVNGIEFFTDSADIVIDGQGGQAESRLRVGMPLRVAGTVHADGKTGTATRVEYAADFRARVDGPAVATTDGALLSIQGSTVLVDERTVFEALLGPGSLAAGDRVEVSGLRDAATGLLRATFVSRTPLAATTVVSGPISGLTVGSFTLGALTVRYDIETAPPLANGMIVRATSTLEPVNGVLFATTLAVVDGSLGALAGSEASAEGLVARLTATGFAMGGLAVRIDRDTRYRNGTAADLADGELVEVEGTVQADGALLASRIAWPSPDRATAEAVVVARSSTAFVLGIGAGVTVEVSAQTRFKDRSRTRAGTFDWRTLRVGDRVSVDGLEVDTATVLAGTVTRLDPGAAIMVSSRSRGVQAPALVLLGAKVGAGATTTYQDADGRALTSQAFFAKAAGRRVKARGLPAADGMAATGYEIEP